MTKVDPAMNAMQQAAHQLLQNDPYNVEILPELVKCVNAQVTDDWYDIDINLAILKLFQFHPEKEEGVVDLDVLIKILTLALMQSPESDFRYCMYLVPMQYQTLDSVVTLINLAEKLESCQYAAFWKLLEEKPEVLAVVSKFADVIRKSIYTNITMTYQEISAKAMSEFLNCPAQRIATDYPDVKQQGDRFILPSNANNQPKPRTQLNTFTDVQLPQLAQVLANTLLS